jgi:adenylate cyclase
VLAFPRGLSQARLALSGPDRFSRASAAAPWTRPLRLLLSLATIVLLVSVSGLLIGLNYSHGRAAALAHAVDRMQAFSSRLGDRFSILFDGAVLSIELASVSDVFVDPPPEQLDAKVSFLRRAVLASPNVDGAYVGYPDGSFVHVVRLGEAGRWRSFLTAPPEAVFAFRSIEPEADGRLSRWTLLDEGGAVLSTGKPEAARFDPRVRPWYRDAMAGSGPVSTAPYTTATTGSLAVTVAEVHERSKGVVVGIDVLLDAISRFLAEEKVAPAGSSFILAENGALIVHSDPTVMHRLVEPVRSVVAIRDDPVVLALQAQPIPDDTASSFDVGGRTYLALAQPLDVPPLMPRTGSW